MLDPSPSLSAPYVLSAELAVLNLWCAWPGILRLRHTYTLLPKLSISPGLILRLDFIKRAFVSTLQNHGNIPSSCLPLLARVETLASITPYTPPASPFAAGAAPAMELFEAELLIRVEAAGGHPIILSYLRARLRLFSRAKYSLLDWQSLFPLPSPRASGPCSWITMSAKLPVGRLKDVAPAGHFAPSSTPARVYSLLSPLRFPEEGVFIGFSENGFLLPASSQCPHILKLLIEFTSFHSPFEVFPQFWIQLVAPASYLPRLPLAGPDWQLHLLSSAPISLWTPERTPGCSLVGILGAGAGGPSPGSTVPAPASWFTMPPFSALCSLGSVPTLIIGVRARSLASLSSALVASCHAWGAVGWDSPCPQPRRRLPPIPAPAPAAQVALPRGKRRKTGISPVLDQLYSRLSFLPPSSFPIIAGLFQDQSSTFLSLLAPLSWSRISPLLCQLPWPRCVVARYCSILPMGSVIPSRLHGCWLMALIPGRGGIQFTLADRELLVPAGHPFFLPVGSELVPAQSGFLICLSRLGRGVFASRDIPAFLALHIPGPVCSLPYPPQFWVSSLTFLSQKDRWTIITRASASSTFFRFLFSLDLLALYVTCAHSLLDLPLLARRHACAVICTANTMSIQLSDTQISGQAWLFFEARNTTRLEASSYPCHVCLLIYNLSLIHI